MYFPIDENFNIIDRCVKDKIFDTTLIKRITKQNIKVWCEKTGYPFPPSFDWKKIDQIIFLRNKYNEFINRDSKSNRNYVYIGY